MDKKIIGKSELKVVPFALGANVFGGKLMKKHLFKYLIHISMPDLIL